MVTPHLVVNSTQDCHVCYRSREKYIANIRRRILIRLTMLVYGVILKEYKPAALFVYYHFVLDVRGGCVGQLQNSCSFGFELNTSSWLTCLLACVVTHNTYPWHRFALNTTIVLSILSTREVMAHLVGCLHRTWVLLVSSRFCPVKFIRRDWVDSGSPVTTALISPTDVPMRSKTVDHIEFAWVCHNVMLLQFSLNPIDYVTRVVSRLLSTGRKTKVLEKHQTLSGRRRHKVLLEGLETFLCTTPPVFWSATGWLWRKIVE